MYKYVKIQETGISGSGFEEYRKLKKSISGQD